MGTSSESVTVGYKYYLGWHAVMCHGPVDKVTRFSMDGKIALEGVTTGGQVTVDAPELFGGDEREGGVSGLVDVEMGAPSQGRNTYLQSMLGEAIPAFRGVLGLVFRQFYFGNSPYFKRWSIRATRIATRQNGMPQWYSGKANVGGDMNPAHIVREILTDPDWGMGYPENDMDETTFRAAADALYSAGTGISLLWDKQQKLSDFLSLILRHIDGSVYTSRETGKFVLVLARGGYNVSSLPLLDETAIESIADLKRSTVAELTNQVTVVYWDKSTGKQNSTTVQDIALAANQGGTVGTTIQYPGFTNGTEATKAASRDLKALSTPLASATLYVSRKAASLNIGDVFRFAWSEYNIAQIIFRVTNIELGELTSNLVKLSVVEDVFAVSKAVYSPPPPSAWVNPIAAPVAVPYRLFTEVPYYLLARAFGDSTAGALPQTASYLMIGGTHPGGTAFSARVQVNEGAGYQQQSTLNFCPTAVVSGTYGPGNSSLTITNGKDLDLVSVGDLVSIGIGTVSTNELAEVVSITPTTLTLKRGMLDTVPMAIANNTRLMFIGSSAIPWTVRLPNEYALSESISVKLLTTTGQGTLPIGSAPADTATVNSTSGRQFRPYPPGKVQINGTAYPTTISGPFALTWAHRDRLQQTGQAPIDQNASNIGPEPGTTYTLRLYGEVGTLLRTETGLTGTSYTWAAEAADSGLYVPGGGADYAAEVLADSPVSYWKLDETSGTTAADATGGNNGTYTGGYTLNQPGIPSAGRPAVLFNGSSGYISLGAPAALNITAAWTLEACVYLTSTPNGCGVITESYTGGSNPILYALGFGLSAIGANLEGGFYTGSDWRTAIGGTLALNAWHHIACTWDGTTLRLYADNSQVGTSSPASGPVAGINGLYIGRRHDVAGSPFFPGRIDEVAIYSAALAAGRITAHHSAMISMVTRLNNTLRFELESVRSGLTSLFKHNVTVGR